MDFEPDPSRPVLIADADEVLVHFARPFGAFLDELGFELALTSYRLSGNILDKATRQPLDKHIVTRLLTEFFETRVADCPPVDGAVCALRQISRIAQIVILSNVPENALAKRRDSLKTLGFGYPVLSNRGPKGPKVRQMVAAMRAPCIFVDDLPHNHASVAEEAPHVHRIHFVADERLRPLILQAEAAHYRVDEWGPARQYIEAYLATSPFSAK